MRTCKAAARKRGRCIACFELDVHLDTLHAVLMTRLGPLRPGLRICCGSSLTMAINLKCAAHFQYAAPGLALPDQWLAHWLPCRPSFNGSFSAALLCSSAAAEAARDTRADVQSTLAPASALLRLPFLMLSQRALPAGRRTCTCRRLARAPFLKPSQRALPVCTRPAMPGRHA